MTELSFFVGVFLLLIISKNVFVRFFETAQHQLNSITGILTAIFSFQCYTQVVNVTAHKNVFNFIPSAVKLFTDSWKRWKRTLWMPPLRFSGLIWGLRIWPQCIHSRMNVPLFDLLQYLLSIYWTSSCWEDTWEDYAPRFIHLQCTLCTVKLRRHTRRKIWIV